MNTECPHCSSIDTIKMSQSYLKSTQSIDMTTNTIGGSLNSDKTISIGGARGKSKGVIQSLESQQTSPPRKLDFLKSAVYIMLFYFAITVALIDSSLVFHLVFWPGIIAIFVGYYHLDKQANERFELEYEEWDRLWLCNRCGTRFFP